MSDAVSNDAPTPGDASTTPDDTPTVTSSGDLQPGTIVGRYRLTETLGEGGMGVVFRAHDEQLHRDAALKFLPSHLSRDAQARDRLKLEARAASALDHPNICTIYEVGETDAGRVYIAMACYDGEPLQKRMARGAVSVDEALDLAVQVASGLQSAHARGIVHRDVKPSNVVVTDDGIVKLLDFGIAKVSGVEMTKTGTTVGTAAYMAPEQSRGRADARSDVWSLGVMLYEMLAGRRPFTSEYEGALLFDVLYTDPDFDVLGRMGASPRVVEIVRQCLAKEPDARFATMADLRAALAEARAAPADAPALGVGVPVAPAPPVAPTPVAVPAPTLAPTFMQGPSTAAPPAESTDAPSAAPAVAVPVGSAATVAPASAPPGRLPIIAGAVAGVALLVAAAIAFWPGGADDPPTDDAAIAAIGGETEATPDAAGAAAPPEADAAAPAEGAAAVPDGARAAGTVAPPPAVTYTPPAAQQQAPAPRQMPVQQAPRVSTPSAPAAPATGTVTVDVRPTGSAVVAGNRSASGSTFTVPAGTHAVTCEHPAYGTMPASARVSGGGAARVTCYFESEVRVATRRAEGSGPAPFATVWVDGRNTGAFTPTTLSLGPGTHRVSVRREGYDSPDGEQTVSVRPSTQPQSHSLSFRIAAQ